MNFPALKFNRKFLSNSSWSLAGNLISVLAGSVSVKIITKLVPADSYGKAALVLGIIALLKTFIVGPLMAAHMRVYFDYVKQSMALWYAQIFNIILLVSGLVSVLIFLVIASTYKFLGNTLFMQLIIPAFLLIILQPFMNAITNYLEAHQLYRRLAIANTMPKVFQLIILYFLLTISISGQMAIIFSHAIALIPLIVIFQFIKDQKDSNKKPDNNWLEIKRVKQSFVGFGLALPLGYFAHWILSTSDRYLIEYFMSIKDVGIYAMNYGFWSIPYMLLNGWLEILTRPYIYNKAVENDWGGVKRIIFQRLIFGLVLSLTGIYLLYIAGEAISRIMLGEAYWAGRQLMITIAAAHTLMVVGYSILPIFLASKKTRWILGATSIAAIVNVMVNIIAIPAYNIIGAAISTLISYFVWTFILSVGLIFFSKQSVDN